MQALRRAVLGQGLQQSAGLAAAEQPTSVLLKLRCASGKGSSSSSSSGGGTAGGAQMQIDRGWGNQVPLVFQQQGSGSSFVLW